MSDKVIEIHGVPMDLGANLRGVDMGPSALRIAGLQQALRSLGHQVSDHDEMHVPSRVALPPDESRAKYEDEIVRVCERLCEAGAAAVRRGSIPIFLGGDHSIAAGTIAGTSSAFKEQGKRLGLVWFDAHTDMNTPDTSPSGNVHGMPLSALLGYGSEAMTAIGGLSPKCDPKNVVVIGARDVDDREKEMVQRAGIKVFSMTEIDTLGIAEVTRQALAIANDGTDGFHLSFDIDGLDPAMAPGVGTPVRGGVTFREAHLMLELIAASERMMAMDVVELNPVLDDRNRTAETVVHLIQSAFGRTIL